jgi:hypothetical protein
VSTRTIGFIVVFGIEIDSAKCVQDTHLPVMTDVFLKGSRDRFLLGFVAAGPARFFDEPVINCEVGRHV